VPGPSSCRVFSLCPAFAAKLVDQGFGSTPHDAGSQFTITVTAYRNGIRMVNGTVVWREHPELGFLMPDLSWHAVNCQVRGGVTGAHGGYGQGMASLRVPGGRPRDGRR